MDGLFQALLGCCWGRVVATAADMDACRMQADRIVVVHDGDVSRDLKLCDYHARMVCEMTTPRDMAVA